MSAPIKARLGKRADSISLVNKATWSHYRTSWLKSMSAPIKLASTRKRRLDLPRQQGTTSSNSTEVSLGPNHGPPRRHQQTSTSDPSSTRANLGMNRQPTSTRANLEIIGHTARRGCRLPHQSGQASASRQPRFPRQPWKRSVSPFAGAGLSRGSAGITTTPRRERI